jgi:proteic killer suppression protein
MRVGANRPKRKIVDDSAADMYYVICTTVKGLGLIRSFASRDTERLYNRERVGQFRSFERIALRKLRMLDAAARLADLKTPPGNRLEKLKGDREGQWSIRINDQW